MRHFVLFLTLIFALFATPSYAQDEAPPAVETTEAVEAPVEEVPTAEEPEEAASVTPEEVEEAVEDAAEVVEVVVVAAQAHTWPILIGVVLIAIVAVLRKVGIEGKLPKGSKALPWVTLALAAAANVGAALLGQLEWGAVLTGTLAAAGIAMGGFDLTKLFRKSSAPAAPAE